MNNIRSVVFDDDKDVESKKWKREENKKTEKNRQKHRFDGINKISSLRSIFTS